MKYESLNPEEFALWEEVKALQYRAVQRLISIEKGDMLVGPKGNWHPSWMAGEHLLVLDVYPLSTGFGSARTQFKRRVKLLSREGPHETDLWEHYFQWADAPSPHEFHMKILKRVVDE